MLETVREAAALLLGRLAGVRVGAFLEGQQVGLLLLQLPLELLGLALLLQLPPLILLRAGRIRLSQKTSQKDGRRRRFVLNDSATRLAESGCRYSWSPKLGFQSACGLDVTQGLICHLNFGSHSPNNFF